jgi:hypothetical protein
MYQQQMCFHKMSSISENFMCPQTRLMIHVPIIQTTHSGALPSAVFNIPWHFLLLFCVE